MATIGTLAIKIQAGAAAFHHEVDRIIHETKALKAAGSTVFEQTRTPLEQYRAAVDALNKMHARGVIDTETFNRALKQERQTLVAASLTFFSVASVLKIVGAAAVVAATGFLALVYRMAQVVVETLKTARSLGATAKGLSELQFGVRSLGGDATVLISAFRKLNAFLADAASGGGAAGEVLAGLKLDPKVLAAQSVDQAFVAIAKAIAAIDDPARRAAAAVQIFGDDAVTLLPLLSQGEAGLMQFAEEARRLGLAVDDIDASKVEDVGIQVDLLKARFEGAASSITQGFIPVLVDGLELVDAILRRLSAAFDRLLSDIATGLAFLAEQLAKLPDKLTGGGFDKVAEDLRLLSMFLRVDSEQKFADIDKGTVGELGKVAQGLRDTAAASKAAKDGFGAVAAAARKSELFRQGLQVFEESKGPMAAFEERMGKLEALLKDGAISFDTYARAAAKAVAELERANQLSDLRLPTGLVRGTSAAVSGITKSQRETDLKLRESPQDRVRRVLEESRELQKRQLEQQRKIADALRARDQGVDL